MSQQPKPVLGRYVFVLASATMMISWLLLALFEPTGTVREVLRGLVWVNLMVMLVLGLIGVR